MAAPCGRMASRSFLTFVSSFHRTAVRQKQCRQFFSTSFCRATLHTQAVTERADSPWALMAAVCLQRLPVISADFVPIEEQFKQMLSQVRLSGIRMAMI